VQKIIKTALKIVHFFQFYSEKIRKLFLKCDILQICPECGSETGEVESNKRKMFQVREKDWKMMMNLRKISTNMMKCQPECMKWGVQFISNYQW
jgi:adenylate cyclase